MSDRIKLLLITIVFLVAYFIPLRHPRVQSAIRDMFVMLQDYAQAHVLFCLVPAFFIAGAIAVFVSQAAVMKYFGPAANRVLSYGVSSVSGTILAVCSCTVLPLFAGIYKRGAGIGPACCFLYSGPAINILAIILTARVLGIELGLARAIGAIIFAIVTGLLMSYFFRQSEEERAAESATFDPTASQDDTLPLPRMASYVGVMVLILIFAAWSRPEDEVGLWWEVYQVKWLIVIPLLGVLGPMLWRWFDSEQIGEWLGATQTFALQIMPLLFAGVLVAGFLLGMPGTDNGIIPNTWVSRIVGGNSIWANLGASVVGAFMYFATLTEVPILQSLLGSGMGKGPALALLLAGPALSLPNMLVIHSVLGTRKTVTFVSIIVVLSTIAGLVYGSIF
ncbi:MAG: permease [candidate division WS1 bacterium]|nr:permease [candidate division WS1 bacterium]